jgi:hypothetical protein
MSKPSNQEIGDVLNTIADLLEAQDANPHRVRAYRTGAQSVEDADEQVADLVHEGEQEKLRELPGIGKGLAGVIREYVETGRSGLLERLQGEMAPGELFAQVPGIGSTLGRRIAQKLDVQSLEELERAAHDGRLQKVEGFGEERVRNVRVALAGMVSRSARRRGGLSGQTSTGQTRTNQMSAPFWMSMPSTGSVLRPANSKGLPPSASIPKMRPGCLLCTRKRKAGTSLRSIPIPPERTSLTRRMTGLSSTLIGMVKMDRRRSWPDWEDL